MLFNSYVFLFLFLPIALAGWYLLNHFHLYRTACAFLAGMSLWFYGYFNPRYLFVLLGSIAMNYGLSAVIAWREKQYAAAACADGAQNTSDSAKSPRSGPVLHDAKHSLPAAERRFFLVLGVGANLAVFFYFKYQDFFIENINAVFGTSWNLRHILLPLGISFFTFQQLSFIVDRAKGEARHYPFLDYLTFVTFFPQLIAGPIVLYDEMMPQFADLPNRKWDPERFARGLILFILGLSKKVLLADTLAVIANYGFDKTFYLDTLTTLLVALSYTFELYFDFSGYCDMAIGLGLLFGIELPVNFDSPFRCATIRDFWAHWHITLQRFFRRYVYIPLGGSRKGKARLVFNVLFVFTLSGFWHGAAWTYIAWGLMHGLLVVFEDLGIFAVKPAAASGTSAAGEIAASAAAAGTKEQKKKHRYLLPGAPFISVPRPVGNFFTMFLFMLSMIFFRSQDMHYALGMFGTLLKPRFPGYLMLTAEVLQPSELFLVRKLIEKTAPGLVRPYSLILWLALLILSTGICARKKNAPEIARTTPLSKKLAVLLAILFVWCVLSLSRVSTFLYFNF